LTVFERARIVQVCCTGSQTGDIVARRLLESFGAFPSSAWCESLAEDLQGAIKVRMASGFMDQRGAREFVELLDPETEVEVLLGLSGCSGPEVILELQKRERTDVKASLVAGFHWKSASIQKEDNRVLYLGSANFTRKGLSGSGEVMLRIGGSALTSGLWDTFQTDYDAFFEPGTTVSGDKLIEILSKVEASFDKAWAGQVQFEREVEEVLAQYQTRQALNTGRIWFVLWDYQFTAVENEVIERKMGPCPLDAWSRGEISATESEIWVRKPGKALEQAQETAGGGIRVGDVVLAYDREDTQFVLGLVGRRERVMLGSRPVWLVDLNHLATPVTSRDNSREYDSIRRILGPTVRQYECSLTVGLYQQVLKTLQSSGLMVRTGP
jgi:hypothetical protein